MADYSQTPPRPNIHPTPLPDTPPRQMAPAPTGWGIVPALGAVAVVGIVALVAWGVLDNEPASQNGATAPDAAPVDTQPAQDPAAPSVVPDAPATPEPMVQPEPVPQEVPAPAPEVAPAPTPEVPLAPAPAPAPAPSN